MDTDVIDARIRQLNNLVDNSKSSRVKQSLEEELVAFLHRLPEPQTLDNVTPQNIRRFLTFYEDRGKTKVHAMGCPQRSISDYRLSPDSQQKQCSCPLKLAASTLDSTIGRLRAIFRDRGRGREWSDQWAWGNPAAAPQIKKHLKCVKLEQAEALVRPKKAVPIFFDKLKRVCNLISYKLSARNLTVEARYELLRDRAYLKLICHSGDRGGDLGLVQTNEILALPDGSGWLFTHTRGKTLQGDNINRFVVKRSADPVICPITDIEMYVAEALSLGINLRDGYLFRKYNKRSHQIEHHPVLAATISANLKNYLLALGLWEGETLHGARAGCAILLQMLGSHEADIETHIGWKAQGGMLEHYTSFHKVVGDQGVAATLSAAMGGDDLGTPPRAISVVKDFSQTAALWKYKKAF